MRVTRVRTNKVESSNGKLLGYADVTVDDAIAIHGIKILEGEKGLFVAFPSEKRVDKENNSVSFSDVVHPVNQETRDMFEKAIIENFKKLDN